MPSHYTPRLSVEITPEQRKRWLDLNLSHGLQKLIIQAVLDDVLDFIARHGESGLAALVAKGVKLEQYVPLKVKE